MLLLAASYACSCVRRLPVPAVPPRRPGQQQLPDAAVLSSMQGLPRSGNSSAQTSASLHPPAALRLRVLPFTRTWSSTVCAEEFPTPLEMSLHGLHLSTGLPLLRHSKSFGPSALIAYATYVSPPDEAVAWPWRRCWMLDMATAWPGAEFEPLGCCK